MQEPQVNCTWTLVSGSCGLKHMLGKGNYIKIYKDIMGKDKLLNDSKMVFSLNMKSLNKCKPFDNDTCMLSNMQRRAFLS